MRWQRLTTLTVVAGVAASLCQPVLAKKPATIETLERRTASVPPASSIASDRDKAIAAYEQFLQLPGGEPRLRAEALRRLADLKLEADEASLSDETPMLVAGTGAAALYETLLRDHPEGADNDRVLYQLARAHEINGASERALAALNLLVADYPASQYRVEAWFRIGELEFVNGHYLEAGLAFGEVLKAGQESAFHAQALYKHGWSLFKQSRHSDCVQSFVALVALSVPADGDLAGADLKRAERELLDDALRALSISFSYGEGPETISDFLASHGELSFEDLLFDRLGALYLEQKRYSDAANAFNGFVARRPVHPRAPLLSSRVIEAYAAGGFAGRVLDAKSAFAERYALQGDFWSNRDSADYPAVLAALKSHIADLANHWHAVAQASKAAPDYQAAIRWYRTALESFPKAAEAPSSSFLLAELLHESGNLSAASRQFEITAYEFGDHPKAAAAGYAALLSYASLQQQPAIDGSDTQAQWRDLHIDSALRFAAVFSDDARANSVRMFAAEALFADGELDAAIDAAVPVTRSSQDAGLLRTAWTVIGHAEFDRLHYADAELAYIELRALGTADESGRLALEERLGAAIYKQAEAARESGQLEAAVAHFLRVGTTVPGAEVHPIADFDAAAVLMGAGNWQAALPLLEKFSANHAGHALNRDVDAKLALAYENTGQAGRAADGYVHIANGIVDATQRRAMLWHAASLYQTVDDAVAAAAVFTTIAGESANQLEELMDAQRELIALARDRGDTPAERRWLNAQIDADRHAGQQRTERSQSLAAQAALTLALPAVELYRDIALTVPLKASLRAKKSRLETALAALNAAAAYSVAEVSTHTGYLVAELYYDFAQSLMQSERPASLDELALEEYELLLEEQAYPFEEKAIDIHQLNAARAADGIYDQWVRDSFARLAQMLPVRYAKTEVSDGLIDSLD